MGERPSLIPSRRRRVAQLAKQGLNGSEIARITGESKTTVYRWIDPAYAERCRAVARDWKRRNAGKCIDCGGPTSLGNSRRPGPAERCTPCRRAFEQAEFLYWTTERVIAAAQDWAAEHGHPPTAIEWRRADPDRRWPAFAECYGKGRIGVRSGWRTWNDFIRGAGLTPRKQGHRLEVAA